MKVIKEVTIRSSKRFVCCFLVFSSCFLIGLCSCSATRYSKTENFPYEELSASYDRTLLKASNALDVLDIMRSPEYELKPGFSGTNTLSQSDIVVALSGQSKDSYKTWFNMVAFDEHNMIARRKYFFLLDENKLAPTKFKRLLTRPKQGLMFDCQIVLQTETFSEPYATEEAMQFAILKQAAENLRRDINEIANINTFSYGSGKLAGSGMLMNQVFESLLFELEKSPSLAVMLRSQTGVEFSHTSFKNGKARMFIYDDVATVEIRLGSPLY